MQPLNLAEANLKSLLSLKVQVDAAIELKIVQIQFENIQLQEQWKNSFSTQKQLHQTKKSFLESDTVLVSGFTDKWNLTRIMEKAATFGPLRHGEYKYNDDDEMDNEVYLVFHHWKEANEFVEVYSSGKNLPFTAEKVKHLKSAEELNEELDDYMRGH